MYAKLFRNTITNGKSQTVPLRFFFWGEGWSLHRLSIRWHLFFNRRNGCLPWEWPCTYNFYLYTFLHSHQMGWHQFVNWGQSIDNCRFSLSHHHQNYSTNKVKNQRDKRRWIFKQSHKGSGMCDVSCGRYLKKCFTQIYKALCRDAMFLSLSGAQIWRPEADKNIRHRVLL